MSKMSWTPAQRKAIDYRGDALLLSAAAGSGKTATLTERIVKLLTEEDSTAEISRMLCVTFTRAAAAELRERIGRKLNEALANHPGNSRLSRQLYDLGRARITTIHAYCLEVLCSHAPELGLPAGFSIAEEADVKKLSAQVMSDILSDLFDQGEDWFMTLADTLAGARNEASLDEALTKLANAVSSAGMEAETLDKLADALLTEEGDFLTSPGGAGIRSYLLRFARHYAVYFADIVEEFSQDKELTDKYLPAAKACLITAEQLRTAAEDGSYSGVRAALLGFDSIGLTRLSKGRKTPEIAYFQEQKKKFSAKIEEWRDKNFALTPEETTVACARTAEAAHHIARVLKLYFDTLRARKREQGIVDFSDLEELTAKLFTDEEGNPSEAAIQAGKSFDYIFIDEYQDTNRRQDSIFSALAEGGGGRFMVGDIKQSIYRFRGAEPEVFSSYRRAWPTEEEDPGAKAMSLFMQENFRCDQSVVDFGNLVSRHIFSTGSIPFTESDELKYAKHGDSPKPAHPVEIRLLPKDSKKDEADGMDEPAYVADRIVQMIGRERREDGTPLTPGDIAILLRSPGRDAAAYADALEARGIRVHNQACNTLYEQPEILLMMSILHAIDNPTRDIHLAAAMKGPVFRFTLDDLVRIRLASRYGSLWDAVAVCAKETVPDAGVDEDLCRRCGEFLDRLQTLRQDARGMGADKLILRLYEESRILTLIEGDRSVDSVSARANLQALYDEARRFENGTGGGLYPFLAHMELVVESGGALPLKDADPNAVRIFSIHNSKGLEFPVCFLPRTDKQWNTQDTTQRVLFDPSVGVAMKLPDEGGVVRCDTPLRQSLSVAMKDALLEEEMRILYVAMTRARERLIITATLSKPEEKLQMHTISARYASDHAVYSAPNRLTWILDAIEIARRTGDERIHAVNVEIVRPLAESEDAEPVYEAEPFTPDEAKVAEYRDLFAKRFAYRYPHSALSGIPAKLTVSRLYPGILDDMESEEGIQAEITRQPSLPPRGEKNRAPRFLKGKTEFEASFAGVATHTFMQFCDFDALARSGAEAELKRLTEAGFLSATMAQAVRLDEIEKFRESDLFARMRSASYMRREFRFNASLPAWEFTADPTLAEELRQKNADIIVQGVVDCLFIDRDGRAVLVDYKTDRLTDKEMADPTLAKKKLVERHKTQLIYYRAVCREMFEREIEECVIYSLPLGRDIAVE